MNRPFTRLYRPRAEHSGLDRPKSTFGINRQEELRLSRSDSRLRRPKVQSKTLYSEVVPRQLNDVVVKRKEPHLTPSLSRLSSSVGRMRKKVDIQHTDIPKVSETDRNPSRGRTPLRLARFLGAKTVLLKNSESSEEVSPLRVTSLAFSKRIVKIPSIRKQVKATIPTKQHRQVSLVAKLPEFTFHNERLKPPRIEIEKAGVKRA
jgi:hypothetical protein